MYVKNETKSDILNDLYKRKGKITPDDLVEEARDPSHLLHGEFEWDDSVAAHEHRKHQAREIIAEVVIIRDDGKKLREFINVKNETTHEHSYQPLQVVVKNIDMCTHWYSNVLKYVKICSEQVRQFEEAVEQSPDNKKFRKLAAKLRYHVDALEKSPPLN